MSSLTIPVGETFFTAEQLNKIVAETIPQIPPGKTGAIAATVDASGATVAVELQKQAGPGDFTITAAYTHDWNGDNSLGGKILYSW